VDEGDGIYALGVAGREVLAQHGERLLQVRERHRPLAEVERRDLLVTQGPRIGDELARKVDLSHAAPHPVESLPVGALLACVLVDVVAAGDGLDHRVLRPHRSDLGRRRVFPHVCSIHHLNYYLCYITSDKEMGPQIKKKGPRKWAFLCRGSMWNRRTST
jgi:hypothetical protein